MRAGQRELRLVVIECRRRPRRIGVAGKAIVIEIAGLVIRIIRLGEIAGMAGETQRRSISIATGVTRLAIKANVSALKRKSGKRVIITARINRHPARRCVAADAVVTQSVCHMIGVGCSCKSHLVAGITVIDRAGISSTVTRLALQIEMRAVDGETGLIMIELSRLPGSCRVTLLTIMAEVRRFVVRVIGRCKPGAVTRETVGRRIGVPAAVTVLAGQCCMCSG